MGGIFEKCRPDAEDDPCIGMTPREREAFASRFGETPTPSYAEIGFRHGYCRYRAKYLIRRGLAKLEANGYKFTESALQGVAACKAAT